MLLTKPSQIAQYYERVMEEQYQYFYKLRHSYWSLLDQGRYVYSNHHYYTLLVLDKLLWESVFDLYLFS